MAFLRPAVLSLALLGPACGARTGLRDVEARPGTVPGDSDICRLQPAHVNFNTEVVTDAMGRAFVLIQGTSVSLATSYSIFRWDHCLPPWEDGGVQPDGGIARGERREIRSVPQPARGAGDTFSIIDSDVERGGRYCYVVYPQPDYDCPRIYIIAYQRIP